MRKTYLSISDDPTIADLQKQRLGNVDLLLACRIERTWWISKIGGEGLFRDNDHARGGDDGGCVILTQYRATRLLNSSSWTIIKSSIIELQ